MKVKFLKSKWMLLFGMASTLLAMLYTAMIFFIGVRASFIPTFLYDSDTRNLVIAVLHTASVLLAIIYFASFFNKKRYDSKIANLGVFNIILYVLGVALVIRCYIINDVEALVFLMTLNGILMSIFLWLLSSLKYDVNDPVTSKPSLLNLFLKTFSIIGLFSFLLAILTYYQYTINFLKSIIPFKIAPVTIDAISVFLFVLGNVLLLASFIITYFCEIRLKSIIRKSRDD